jgi:hypothetical protein
VNIPNSTASSSQASSSSPSTPNTIIPNTESNNSSISSDVGREGVTQDESIKPTQKEIELKNQISSVNEDLVYLLSKRNNNTASTDQLQQLKPKTAK